MRHRSEAHILRGRRGESRSPPAAAEENERLVLRENLFVVGARRINPELQHPAWAMEGTRHAALALQFSWVPEVDEHGVAGEEARYRIGDRDRIDFCVRFLDQRLVAARNGLGHDRDLACGLLIAGAGRNRNQPGEACLFNWADILALAAFVAAWLAYHVTVERTPAGTRSLNTLMNRYRFQWMEQMAHRENRIVDTTIMASLQSGTAFFASTALIAIGGVLALLQSADVVVTIVGELPIGETTTRAAWEVKVIGLAVIFVYAFFKFSWSYRLFNYAAILLGAVPILHSSNEPEVLAAARRAAAMNAVAGRHFNRGQRAFFFALAYLGWFISAYVLMATTAAVLYVMWRRQFMSDAREAVLRGEQT
jgi:uncharacterized membrane protein